MTKSDSPKLSRHLRSKSPAQHLVHTLVGRYILRRVQWTSRIEKPSTTLKNLVVTGYFTSEVGAKQALIFDPVPGPYKGCIDFSEVKGVYAL